MSIIIETIVMEKKFNNTLKKIRLMLKSIYNHYNEYKNTKVIIYGERGQVKHIFQS